MTHDDDDDQTETILSSSERPHQQMHLPPSSPDNNNKKRRHISPIRLVTADMRKEDMYWLDDSWILVEITTMKSSADDSFFFSLFDLHSYCFLYLFWCKYNMYSKVKSNRALVSWHCVSSSNMYHHIFFPFLLPYFVFRPSSNEPRKRKQAHASMQGFEWSSMEHMTDDDFSHSNQSDRRNIISLKESCWGTTTSNKNYHLLEHDISCLY